MYTNLERKILNICKYNYSDFFSKANVIGLGLGYKITKDIKTLEKVIKVYVTKKVPPSFLNTNDIIPPFYNYIKTDVIESGEFKTCSLTDRSRPVTGGYNIGPYNFPYASGSYGGLVIDNNSNLYILSCNHVIADNNRLPLNYAILQPSTEFGGNYPNDFIATLYAFVPINFTVYFFTPENYVDAAIAKVITPSDISPIITFLGIPEGISEATLGLNIQIVCSESEHSFGTIDSLGTTLLVNYSSGEQALFLDQILTTAPTLPGDSGSLLLDLNLNVIGLNFANSSGLSAVNPINPVLTSFNVNLVTVNYLKEHPYNKIIY